MRENESEKKNQERKKKERRKRKLDCLKEEYESEVLINLLPVFFTRDPIFWLPDANTYTNNAQAHSEVTEREREEETEEKEDWVQKWGRERQRK